MNNIIFVEGIPGCGKSTTSQYIYEQLKNNGYDVEWLHEGIQDHPFYERHNLYNEQGFLDKDAFVDYLNVFKKEMKTIKDLVEGEGKVFVVDGLILTGFTNTYLNADCKDADIQTYFKALMQVLVGLKPLLVYLETKRVKDHTLETWEGRASWGCDRVVQAYSKAPRVQRTGKKGKDVLYEYINPIQDQNLNYYDQFPYDKLRFVIDQRRYEDYHETILDHMGLFKGKELIDEKGINRYVGIYDNDGYKENMKVKILDQQLVCDWGEINMVLTYVSPNVYNLRSYPIYLKFIEEEGQIKGIETYGQQCYDRAGWYFQRVEKSKY